MRFGAASGAAGRLWAVSSADVGGLLGVGRTQLAARVKVTNNLSTSVLAKLTCFAVRGAGGSPVQVSPVYEIRPSAFASGAWREISVKCDFLPDDQSQIVAMDEFTTGITDLSVDYARVTPLAVETHLLGARADRDCAADL